MHSRFVALALTLWVWASAAAADFPTTADQAVAYDFETWQLLYTKNADARMSPSSMTKMMTAYLVFEAIENGEVSLETRLSVSANAHGTIGSRTWLRLGTTVSVERMLNGLIVQSGNDAAIALAEGIGGDLPGFVARMNAKAAELGMTNTSFANPSGLSGEGHYSTANDIALLARALIANYPQFYGYFSRPSYTYDGIEQFNRNLLLGGALNVDGIKTGYTEAGGYGQASSAVDPQTGRRVIVVINGTESIGARQRESEKLVDFALSDFSNHHLFTDGQVIGHVPIWLGVDDQVEAVVRRDVYRTLNRDAINTMRGTLLLFESPINAPVQEGQLLGKLLYSSPGMTLSAANFEEPVYAGATVEALGTFDSALEGVRYYLFD